MHLRLSEDACHEIFVEDGIAVLRVHVLQELCQGRFSVLNPVPAHDVLGRRNVYPSSYFYSSQWPVFPVFDVRGPLLKALSKPHSGFDDATLLLLHSRLHKAFVRLQIYTPT